MNGAIQRLKVSPNNRLLLREDGSPFFWLGDTAWELFHKLNREEAELYLRQRSEQGYNVVQAVALAEFGGVTSDNAYGRRPFLVNGKGNVDPLLPDTVGEYSYWEHVDFIIRLAASLGLYIAFLPTWGDKFNQLWGKGPEIFQTQEQAYSYGKWLGERYQNDKNIVWVLGGDRALQKRLHFEVINSMASGIKAGDGGAHLMTFHPKGSVSSSDCVHEEAWLDFNMLQSGHGDGERTNYKLVEADFNKLPVKPTLDAEPCYEDIPRGFNSDNGYFDEVDVRKAAYYAVFSGGFGHTYGHHSVWSMCDGFYSSFEMSDVGTFFIMDWKEALARPGASQMKHLRTLMESNDLIHRLPDQGLISNNFTGSNYMVGTRGNDYALIYCPNGLYVNAVMGLISGIEIEASWFCPRSGESIRIGTYKNSGIQRFTAPSSGRGNDWILCMEDAV